MSIPWLGYVICCRRGGKFLDQKNDVASSATSNTRSRSGGTQGHLDRTVLRPRIRRCRGRPGSPVARRLVVDGVLVICWFVRPAVVGLGGVHFLCRSVRHGRSRPASAGRRPDGDRRPDGRQYFRRRRRTSHRLRPLLRRGENHLDSHVPAGATSCRRDPRPRHRLHEGDECGRGPLVGLRIRPGALPVRVVGDWSGRGLRNAVPDASSPGHRSSRCSTSTRAVRFVHDSGAR